MEFDFLKDKEKGLLTAKELRAFESLVRKGRSLLKDLSKESTYPRLKKLISRFVKAVDSKKEMLEGIIERTLSVNAELSVHVNELITNTKNLIKILKRARVINRYLTSLINRLEQLLAKYKVFTNLDVSVKYWSGKTVIGRRKIILGFDDLSIVELIKSVLKPRRQLIESNFLLTDEDVIESGVVVDFITGLNDEDLKLAINEDPSHADFLMKAYVVLRHQVKQVRSLVNLMNDKSTATSESELNANISLVNKELRRVSNELVQALGLLKEARDKSVRTERLVSLYNENELLRDSEDVLKSYLRYKFKIDDLLKQLMYDYLVVYHAVPGSLNKYNDFKNRSRYVFLKKFFSKI
ncbi:hypothetical protein GF352_04500 [archaeon]|nr:hypothetical protein [archaeon]